MDEISTISNRELRARLLRIERTLGLEPLPVEAVTVQQIKEIRTDQNLSMVEARNVATTKAIQSLFEEER